MSLILTNCSNLFNPFAAAPHNVVPRFVSGEHPAAMQTSGGDLAQQMALHVLLFLILVTVVR